MSRVSLTNHSRVNTGDSHHRLQFRGENKGDAFVGISPPSGEFSPPQHQRLSKNESVTSVKFGSSAKASNATELSASRGLRFPDLPCGALPPVLLLGAPPPDPYIGSRSRARHDGGSSPPNATWPRYRCNSPRPFCYSHACRLDDNLLVKRDGGVVWNEWTIRPHVLK